VVVAGNHDQAAVKKLAADYFNASARAAIAWTAEQVRDDDRWWLSGLPLVHAGEAYSLVHSSFDQPGEFGYIFNPEDAGPSFEKQPTLLGFFGHTHWPTTFIDSEPITHSLQPVVPVVEPVKMLVNVGSVGQPRDSNPEAGFVVLDHDEKRVRFLRRAYDIRKAAQKIVEAGLPAMLAERLFIGY
jgi:diadenosine tetraphosphatase ApaH/serine/threonine PP2A family protein phosphatase